MLVVSITRARLACIVSYAKTRFVNGRIIVTTPSQFSTHLGKAFDKKTSGMPRELAEQAVEAIGHTCAESPPPHGN